MKSLLDHIEHLRGKPHHIRKKIAFTVAGMISGVIAIAWFSMSLISGSFLVPNTSFADLYNDMPTVATTSADGTSVSGLAGVAASENAKNQPAHIEIVDTNTSTSVAPEKTTIPF